MFHSLTSGGPRDEHPSTSYAQEFFVPVFCVYGCFIYIFTHPQKNECVYIISEHPKCVFIDYVKIPRNLKGISSNIMVKGNFNTSISKRVEE